MGNYFDEFIAQGRVSNDGQLIQFIVDNITKDIVPINIEAPDIGSSSFTSVDENGKKIFCVLEQKTGLKACKPLPRQRLRHEMWLTCGQNPKNEVFQTKQKPQKSLGY